jgi:hypothetical protein
MDFIKRNLGFLLFVTGSLLAAAVLGVLWWQSGADTREYREKVQSQEQFLDGVRRGQFALNQDNVQIARRNQAVAEEAFREFLQALVVRYGIPARTGIQPLECVRVVKEERERMRQELADPARDIQVASAAAGFSFDSILTSSTLPLAEDVPVILKHLQIVGEVVRVAGRSGLREFRSIGRPHGLASIKKDLYSVVPLEVSISGNYKSIQRFVNQLQQRDTAGIFILRSIELTSRDQAAGNLLGSEAMGAPGVRTGRTGLPAGAPFTGLPAGSRRPPAGAGGVPPAVEPLESKPVLLDEVKDRRTVFTTHDLDARILIDFVEFKKPAEES